MLGVLRLDGCADTPVAMLSGGEARRLSLAAEVLAQPPVICADEPTTGLDAPTALALVSSLSVLARRRGHTVITTIHQPGPTVTSLFDSLLLLSEGRVAYCGAPVSKSCGASKYQRKCIVSTEGARRTAARRPSLLGWRARR